MESVTIILLFFILSTCSVPGMSSNQPLNKTNSADFLIHYSTGLTHFSTYVDDNKSTANIYTANTNANSLNLNNYSIVNYQLESSNTSTYSLSQLLGNFGYVQYLNYFISNNSRFVTLRTYLDPTNTFTILSLNTNKSISFQSNTSAYYLSLINRFSNSSDVYFSLNNETNFIIVKYSFSTNNFSIFFQKTYPGGIEVPITGIYKDNRIFFLLNIMTKSSHLLILNEQGYILDKTFQNYQIETFTPVNNGFLMYLTDNVFYFYDFTNVNYQLSIPNIGYVKILRPLNNNTFVAIGTNYLSIVKVNETGQSIDLQAEYTYTINYQDDLYLQYLFQALDINGMNYYMYQNQNYSSGDTYIAINHIYTTPTNYNNPLTTTTTNSYSTSQNQAQIQSTSSTVSIQTLSNNNSLIYLILLGSIFLVAGFIVFMSTRKSRNPRRKLDFLSINNRHDKTVSSSNNNVSKIVILKSSSCSNCGGSILPDDLFCQNCGNKI